MPKTKFQDFIFTIIMVIVMVYAMVCYNIAFDKGGMSSDIFLLALHELPIMGAVGFVLEFFAVGKLSQKVTFKHFDPKKYKSFRNYRYDFKRYGCFYVSAYELYCKYSFRISGCGAYCS